MPEVTNDLKRIKASPTKAFFIHMLTRDVQLSRAILDLVDNCVDGARRERDVSDYAGLWVRIEVEKDNFKIADNCGGIPVRVAREYAFRFGRPNDAEETPDSIGQFGVGMKRSFFKLGREFVVQSATKNSRFVLSVDVDLWMAENQNEKTDDWHFEFQSLGENLSSVGADEIGTRIQIRRLRDAVGESFELENFRTRLSDEISAAHAQSMDRGLAISLNGIPIRHTPHKLLHSTNLMPAFIEKIYPRTMIDGEAEPPVKVKLYAGIADGLADIATVVSKAASGSFLVLSINAQPIVEPNEEQRKQLEEKSGEPFRLSKYRLSKLKALLGRRRNFFSVKCLSI